MTCSQLKVHWRYFSCFANGCSSQRISHSYVVCCSVLQKNCIYTVSCVFDGVKGRSLIELVFTVYHMTTIFMHSHLSFYCHVLLSSHVQVEPSNMPFIQFHSGNTLLAKIFFKTFAIVAVAFILETVLQIYQWWPQYFFINEGIWQNHHQHHNFTQLMFGWNS